MITSPYLTESGEPIQVPRSWRERFLTRPWRPWRATKTHVPQVPKREILQIGNVFYMHPEMLKELASATALDRIRS